MTLAPTVSVVVPLFNAEAYVGEALASILSQHHVLEVIVVDDGSTDRSIDVVRDVRDTRCRLVRQSRLGAAAARNSGIAMASGNLLAFLDADDVWSAAKLERQVRALTERPAIDMVFGHYAVVRARGGATEGDEPRPGYSLGTMLIRRDAFAKVGPLATEWRVGEFIEWYARAEEAGLSHLMLPEVLLHRRVHDGNLTRRDRSASIDYARILHAVAARRTRLRSPQGMTGDRPSGT